MSHQHSDKVDHAMDKGKELLDQGSEALEKTASEAHNRLSDAIEAAKNAYGRIQDRAVEGAKATDKAIRDRPYQSIAVAFGVGALLGFLLSRRSKD